MPGSGQSSCVRAAVLWGLGQGRQLLICDKQPEEGTEMGASPGPGHQQHLVRHILWLFLHGWDGGEPQGISQDLASVTGSAQFSCMCP